MTAPNVSSVQPTDSSVADHLWCASNAIPIKALITFIVAGTLAGLIISTLRSKAPEEPNAGEPYLPYLDALRFASRSKVAAWIALVSANAFTAVYIVLFVRLDGKGCGANLSRGDDALVLYIGIPLFVVAILAALYLRFAGKAPT